MENLTYPVHIYNLTASGFTSLTHTEGMLGAAANALAIIVTSIVNSLVFIGVSILGTDTSLIVSENSNASWQNEL